VTDRKRIIVGVAGGIAAYKAATVVRQLTEAGHSVRVVPTESALRFIGAATFEALSGNPVHTGVFDEVHEVPHVRIGQEADLVVVAPATARANRSAVAGLTTC
jgi:phosphopantothenoylcysteine decarboxylase / phosphopantothenate---cysteine ligase